MSGEPDLYPNTSGEWIIYLQQLMIYRGYWQGTADGEFSDGLAAAVRSLQQRYGLTPDGVVRADMWGILTGATQSASPGTPSGAASAGTAGGLTATGAEPGQVPVSESQGGWPAFEFTLGEVPIAEADFDTGSAAIHVELNLTGKVKVSLPGHAEGVTLTAEGLQFEAKQSLHGITDGLQVSGLGTGAVGIAGTYGNQFGQTSYGFEDGAMVYRGQCAISYSVPSPPGSAEVEGSVGYSLKVRVIPHPGGGEPEPASDTSGWFERNEGALAIVGVGALGIIAILAFPESLPILALSAA
jgi:peptidoglycan hydrolase-like protein with peptidoglycan-binding domain